MDDYCFQCDYCGEVVGVGQAEVFYRSRRELSDGRTLVVMGTYCGRYCGERHAAASVSGGLTG